MKKPLPSVALLARVTLTLVVVVVAALVLWHLAGYYMYAPWTRDGHVGANVIQVAPDVSGLIVQVDVNDNQAVRRGQVLFVIDPERYELALHQAEATFAQREATFDQARREAARNKTLGDLVARELLEESEARVKQADAACAEAQVAIGVARLNLQRATIVSPVGGYLSDRAPRTGEFVTAGRSVLAITDTSSFHVDGYFEETKLRGIAIGQPVTISVMGEGRALHGHVQSIVAAIEDRDRAQGTNLLPNVNPAFSWVRLAQRIPVRIALDDIPPDFQLIAGRTATVSIDEHRAVANDASRQPGALKQSAQAAKPASGSAQ
ncbi:efflux transporter periplasmic adaptor subunit [Paraburkholderia phytofirmans OLGA172]|uniref:Efflux transporter periplasmic adaptor subunit n=1 Tax=Paraburkholderia phytofirmans OLGA172 TaxID=1417228 RepID=A0A160FJ83_9BURK|nr:HlyD family secretion protein [Paraburkholderia phytofirmans]ANB72214.1 efflux transporter periplasmic adaptor subunit [Paraburkholderia phytofirmans OLGA172]